MEHFRVAASSNNSTFLFYGNLPIMHSFKVLLGDRNLMDCENVSPLHCRSCETLSNKNIKYAIWLKILLDPSP